MVISKLRSKRKITGGRYVDSRKKKLIDKRNLPRLTKFAARKLKNLRMRGGSVKRVLLSADTANVYDPKTKKYSKVKIKVVVENPANRHFVRRNILTKGSFIETELGKARITSRPGQEGSVDAVLV